MDTRADEKSIIKGVFGISPLILYFPSKILPGLLISFVAFILHTYANMGEGQQKQKAFTNMHVRFTYSTPLMKDVGSNSYFSHGSFFWLKNM